MEELDLRLPIVLGDEPIDPIRPEIEALILRGSVEISEIEHINCTKVEADALIPALTNDAFARRLDRVLSNIKLPGPPLDGRAQPLWNLYNATLLARKRLERKIYHSPYDDTLVQILSCALTAFGPPTHPGITYLGAMHVMAVNALVRLKN